MERVFYKTDDKINRQQLITALQTWMDQLRLYDISTFEQELFQYILSGDSEILSPETKLFLSIESKLLLVEKKIKFIEQKLYARTPSLLALILTLYCA